MNATSNDDLHSNAVLGATAHRLPDIAAKGPLAGTPSLAGLDGMCSGGKANGRSHAGSSMALTCRAQMFAVIGQVVPAEASTLQVHI